MPEVRTVRDRTVDKHTSSCVSIHATVRCLRRVCKEPRLIGEEHVTNQTEDGEGEDGSA